LVGRSESWLSQVERGLRQVDGHGVLMSLAEVLRVDVAELTGDEPTEHRTAQYTAAQEIERAMMAYDGLEAVIRGDETEHPPDVARLLLGLSRVNRAYQGARYEEAGRMLPALIRGVETSARTCPRSDATSVSRCRCQIYQATAMVLSRVGEPRWRGPLPIGR